MLKRKFAWMGVLLVAVLVVSPGCVSKKLFRKNVEDTETRISSVESGVEANERRIQDLKAETDSEIAKASQRAEKAVEIGNTAMNKAENAQQTAEQAKKGKLLWSVTLSNDDVKFGFDQASLADGAKQTLNDLAAKIKSYGKAVYIEIEGHTDSVGGEDYNLRLGEKRAEAVRNYLGRQGGIPLHAMNVISFGESQPVADNSTANGRAKNRRVVVKVLE